MWLARVWCCLLRDFEGFRNLRGLRFTKTKNDSQAEARESFSKIYL